VEQAARGRSGARRARRPDPFRDRSDRSGRDRVAYSSPKLWWCPSPCSGYQRQALRPAV